MVEELAPSELQTKLEDGADVQVVDTRSPRQYTAGHIPGATNVPYGQLAGRIDEIDWGEEVVLVCQEGISSVQAGRLLESYEGIDDDATVASLAGGYDAWEFDLETED
ncbi:sulfurtransferase [Halorientalis sp. IM1011]|uniref:rhodanese-like domain-containing protein n=1 Tax=Halorientalis sp. IM1011 TaxID=1932360 RepID=UPI00097CD71C|nr:rhodanese-like domain-containing protein [Halorientalis sp. IM1011]AQL43141.1 sulfurtransferase [Halorientalis sp. IM1011]